MTSRGCPLHRESGGTAGWLAGYVQDFAVSLFCSFVFSVQYRRIVFVTGGTCLCDIFVRSAGKDFTRFEVNFARESALLLAHKHLEHKNLSDIIFNRL